MQGMYNGKPYYMRKVAGGGQTAVYLYQDPGKKQWRFSADLGGKKNLFFASEENSRAVCPGDNTADGTWQAATGTFGRFKKNTAVRVVCNRIWRSASLYLLFFGLLIFSQEYKSEELNTYNTRYSTTHTQHICSRQRVTLFLDFCWFCCPFSPTPYSVLSEFLSNSSIFIFAVQTFLSATSRGNSIQAKGFSGIEIEFVRYFKNNYTNCYFRNRNVSSKMK